MSVYRLTYMYNGQKKQSEIWWYSIEIGKQRERKSTHTKLKTLALKFEENRRRELERVFAGRPSVEPKSRIETVNAYLFKYVVTRIPATKFPNDANEFSRCIAK